MTLDEAVDGSIPLSLPLGGVSRMLIGNREIRPREW